jgi:hypothetical protein
MLDELGPEITQTLTDFAQAAPGSSVYVGRIVGWKQPGQVLVEYDDGEQKEARVIAGLKRDELFRAGANRSEALIVFERGDPDRPIIVALMENGNQEPADTEPGQKQPPVQAVIDGETVKIEARKQVVLRCGKGSITINKNGKIVVRGTHLLSRSSGPNRIKGGHVDIN